MKKNDFEKCIAVWLDHEKAYFIKPGKNETEIEKMLSGIKTHMRIPGEVASGMRLGNNRSSNNEYSKHSRQHEEQSQYFKTLCSRLKAYDYIILFGPSTAKNEFGNFMSKDKAFHGKHVEIKNAEEMTDHQLVAKVSEFFMS